MSYKLKRLEIYINIFNGMNALKYLRNEFNFWNVHGIMNTSGLLQRKYTLQDTQSIDDSMNRPTFEFIAYIYILLQISKI